MAGAELHVLQGLVFPEAVLVLPGVAAVCTNVFQTHTSLWAPHDSLLVSLALWQIGHLGPCRLGPPKWLQAQVLHLPESRSSFSSSIFFS